MRKDELTKQGLLLQAWFTINQRPLPWRESQDPYRIWIAEIMLQQTTVKAVLPFYERFLKRFPDVKSLAVAKLEDVYPLWAGLGYYSRARNLKKAAEQIYELGDFPRSHIELGQLSGLGPYTSRAISSQAFEERVGVVDGNVIRVLSRYMNEAIEHWTPRGRQQLQQWADELVQSGRPSQINQAVMELGATLCTKHNPACLLCPIKKSCAGFAAGTVNTLPVSKPRRSQELWYWQVQVYRDGQKIAFIRNQVTPFLREQWVLPGEARSLDAPPKTYDLVHTITHHKIFLKVTRPKANFKPAKGQDSQWIPIKRLKSLVPFSVIHKALDVGLADKKNS